ncbi:Diacylglycerol kinase family enzyme [Goodfellowiella coeruleoviolacea]|uniref:Diacylglycerol kinase family enzyme n=1 Tax=Goodfellowiella coeruleoviolacea TaxID=334858 RepID=A0AAE3KI13_9PSEU|nr:Diacylglycerol kinase family enzyme [Goodfellowiella coeruleoviolacea]
MLAHALASAVKLEVVETHYRGHAADTARHAVTDGVDLVVAHGGDGTVNEVVNGLLRDGAGEHVPMLGVVPGGSANVFARALGLPRDPVEATHHLLKAIEAGRSRQVGLGRAAGRWFTFNAGLGWDADVVAEVERRRSTGWRPSPTGYARTALSSYSRQLREKTAMTVELPGQEPITGLRLVFVSNTDPWTYLGPRPIRLNPHCTFDGGLGLFGLRQLGLPTVLRHLGQVFRDVSPHGGNLVRRDDVEWVRVSCEQPVHLQIDGDHLGQWSEVEFLAVPNALRVAV